MTVYLQKLREWLPSMISVAVLIYAFVYAATQRSRAAEDIQQVDSAGATLTASASTIQNGTFSPQQVQQLKAQKEDLEGRLQDALKPALVVSELSESARKAGLMVQEIQPVRQKSESDKQATSFPQYRITVLGAYRQIAAYINGFSGNRLPVRVISFRLSKPSDEANKKGQELRAEIVVEAFVPQQ